MNEGSAEHAAPHQPGCVQVGHVVVKDAGCKLSDLRSLSAISVHEVMQLQ
jgi:hypothetical protein